MASLDALPNEVLRRILWYTDLVLPYQKTGLPQGLYITNGRLQQKIPTALFYVCRRLSNIARELVFSANRIILDEGIVAMSAWISSQPQELLDHIKDLDITMLFYPGISINEEACTELVTTLQKLRLNNLTLSIDGAYHYETTTEDVFDFEWIKEVYSSLVGILKAGDLHQLRRFFVFWPKWRSLEAEAEKAVMGPNYDSIALGKVPYRQRDWRMPHGWEWGTEDDYGPYALATQRGLNQDWLDYQAAGMQDCE